ncbi:MAG: bifunctional glycosyltransferase/class I SAM-dependent methyltransferase [Acidimicrobiales bacterium]
MSSKRIGILVVAYNAASTLAQVLDRIPPDFRGRITKVLVGDDASQDSTHLVALGYKQLASDLPIEVIRHPENLGYGGNQKAGYQWAIDNDLDIVVLLHGDGQYAPELLPEMVAPLERGEADAVFGSRMLDPGGARRGGMPRYKFVGNRILTTVENAVAGASLSEWHSGYRAYSVAAMADIPFHRNDNGFNFDTQVIVQLIEAGKRIVEVPIPTYYGDEICHVNGMGYARDVTRDVVRYRAHKMGFGSGELAFASEGYDAKHAEGSSHELLLRWLGGRSEARILDLGCADGYLAERLRALGHHVTGVDLVAHDGVKERVDVFVEADLDQGLPPGLEGPFDVVLAADVLEHVRTPEHILEQVRPLMAPGASWIVSVPNFGHWYPRTRVAIGRFDYDRRGILDRDHVRFFTKRSFERLVEASGFRVVRRTGTGLPLEVVDRGGHGQQAGSGRVSQVLERIDRASVAARPQLFAYQFVYELAPNTQT